VKKKATLIVLALGLLMMFAAVAPVLAYNPKPCFSFTMGEVDVANGVGQVITKDNTAMIGIGDGSNCYRYSSLLGYWEGSLKNWFYLSLPSYTGGGVITWITSISVDQAVWSANGLGLWTYDGPTFTYSGPTITPPLPAPPLVSGEKITTGEVFYGLLVTATGIIHFTSGPLAGETCVTTSAGVGYGVWGVYSATVYVH